MSDVITKFDAWLNDKGPAALVLREHLMPVEGHDGVLFPATFAASKDKTFKGGYNIDRFADGANVCLVDSVGSQANRIEPLFMKKDYAGLVPQIVIKAGSKKINLLEAGHRAGDAIIRCSELQTQFQDAFKAALNGNAEPMAKIAPTSLIFGVWDSRDTQAKLPRLIDSKIRALNVEELTRSAQYIPAAEYVNEKMLDEPSDDKTKDAYAERGFMHQPATGTHGGVIATGGVRRDATLHLAALRLLSAENDESTLKLRRYIFGLALTAFTCKPSAYLRQGCNLVSDPGKANEFSLVHNDGKREGQTLTHEEALVYAKEAARAFGIEPDRAIIYQANLKEPSLDREVNFDQNLAKKDLEKKEGDGSKKTAKKAK